ncbi:MAG TPA: S41 family peptidase, partial [Bacillota bacterium]|nr:S41 family peptidase [Bacillota bacterium]
GNLPMKKTAGHVFFLFLLLVCGGFCLLGAASKPKTEPKPISLHTYSVKQLKEDFEQFQNTIKTNHPMLYTNQAELNELFINQAQLLKGPMGELEFYRILAPIVAKLNCGHTRLGLSGENGSFYYQSSRYLPLQLKVIHSRIYVVQSLSKAKLPPGSEILSINGRPTVEIIQALLNNISADGANLSKKYYEMNHSFNDLYFTYIETPKQFVITYIAPHDSTGLDARNAIAKKVTLTAVNKGKLGELIWNQSPPQKENEGLSPYWSQFTKNYALLTIESFGFYNSAPQQQFKTFIDQFFNELAEAGLANLILDLRDNWGGDPYCSAYLFSYLLQTPQPYFAEESPYYYDLKQPLTPASDNFKGSLYILTNGASFSSTGHLCSLLKYHRIGVFIGEETGGSFVCTDSSRDEILLNTGIQLHYSTMAFKTAVSGLTPGRGIMPDYEVVPTIQDYLQRKDVELDFAVGLIEKKK